ncbi:hypothetical protein [Macrococcoides caseolyticum]|uniref:hypothetical protein n=1 Tax=Macrococcoides caseolyticum TaxID=69966 RepID=UPI001F338184|nr:hypothetical protein [Macrococcus caseolyticus]MCE4956613.1 hypothetical protein [Macrococcus caseolyticus]
MGSVWGNGRYVYKIVVNTDYKTVNYKRLNAAYKNAWTKDADKIYAKIGDGNTEIKFDIPKWKTNPNTSYVKGYTIQIKHLPGFSLEAPYVVYPKKDIPYLVQDDFIKSIKANGLNYKGIYLINLNLR